jgi:penicillin-binding protein 1C
MKKQLTQRLKKHYRKIIVITSIVLIWLFCLQEPLFKDPFSTVLSSREHQLLGARIAKDGQWRFPPVDSVPDKFAKAIISFEDKRFYHHIGVDPLATARALRLNVSEGKVVSGGSTLSMQVIRLSRKGKGRTYLEKIIEMILATRLEARYTKAEILALYASYAPFGGNVVGIDAAAWKYFGRSAHQLSWAESATLAVLPNAPSLIHPGKNRDALKRKRDELLQKMSEIGIIDSLTAALGQYEPLPQKPLPLPAHAPHLLEQVRKQKKAGPQTVFHTSINYPLQQQANRIIAHHHAVLSQNDIQNAAALIVEVETGHVISYVGNAPCDSDDHGCTVDVIPARRSTGSILKPFLYAAMLDDGEILPNTLVPDVPSRYGGYHPQNYDRDFDGAVPAHRALARSLNVPSVHMLNQYGLARFHNRLQQYGMTTLDYGPAHYGLTLILGGAEASLWDLAGMYASMARTLRHHQKFSGQYLKDDFRPITVEISSPKPYNKEELQPYGTLSAAAIYQTFEAMTKVNRPEEDRNWQAFASKDKIAWKTGTSYGFRDAWAIGLTPTHVVAVWVGNADGEGRPGLIGVESAAPIMFDLFDALDKRQNWFAAPFGELKMGIVCKKSGHLAGPNCPTDSTWVYQKGLESKPCPYHKRVHLDQSGQFRVDGDCYSPQDMKHKAFFILPPIQESYYQSRHPDFTPLPPIHPDCKQMADENKAMELVYPKFKTKIYIPIDLDGEASKTVFEVTHRDPEAVIYWHLDDYFLGQTQGIHEMALHPKAGIHRINLVDMNGERLERKIEILEK